MEHMNELLTYQIANNYMTPSDGFCKLKSIVISKDILFFLQHHRIQMMFWSLYKRGRMNFLSVTNEVQEALILQEQIQKSNAIKQQEIADTISDLFTEEGVDHVFLKGLPLSLTIYQDAWHRLYQDIDVLVPREQARQAAKLLIKTLGYQYGGISESGILYAASKEDILFQELHTHELYNLSKWYPPSFVSNIDINFRFQWQGLRLSMDSNIPYEVIRSHIIEQNGIKTLDPSFQFIHLCCHLYNETVYFALDRDYPYDHPDGDSQVILLFRLIDLLLLSTAALEPSLIVDICNQYDITYKIQYALGLCEILFDASIASRLLDIFPMLHCLPQSAFEFYYDKHEMRQKWPVGIVSRVYAPAIK